MVNPEQNNNKVSNDSVDITLELLKEMRDTVNELYDRAIEVVGDQ